VKRSRAISSGRKPAFQKNPKWKPPLVLMLLSEDGTQKDVYASGSLAYIEENAAKDPAQKLIMGQFTVITKTGSYVNKQGRDFPTFNIQQDDAKTTGTTGQATETAATTPIPGASIQDRLARARQVS
jgi:hypothetical protein